MQERYHIKCWKPSCEMVNSAIPVLCWHFWPCHACTTYVSFPCLKNYHFLCHFPFCSSSSVLACASGPWPHAREPTAAGREPLPSSGFPSVTFPYWWRKARVCTKQRICISYCECKRHEGEGFSGQKLSLESNKSTLILSDSSYYFPAVTVDLWAEKLQLCIYFFVPNNLPNRPLKNFDRKKNLFIFSLKQFL